MDILIHIASIIVSIVILILIVFNRYRPKIYPPIPSLSSTIQSYPLDMELKKFGYCVCIQLEAKSGWHLKSISLPRFKKGLYPGGPEKSPKNHEVILDLLVPIEQKEKIKSLLSSNSKFVNKIDIA